jgi:hypothetical protein
LAFASALALAACTPATPGGSIDGGEPDDDGGHDTAGLVLEFATAPKIPTDLPGGVQVDRLDLTFFDLRLLGDSAPGDERTSATEVQLEFREAGKNPEAQIFEDAPPGRYSSFKASLGADDGEGPGHFRIRGKVMPGGGGGGGGGPIKFDLELEQTVAVSRALDFELPAGGRVTLDVGLDLAAVLAGIDWDELPEEEGTLRLPEDSEAARRLSENLKIAVTVTARPPR